MRNSGAARPLFMAGVISLTFVLGAPARAPQGQNDDDELRKIWDEGLLRKRRGGKPKNYKYRRVTPALPQARKEARGKNPAPRPQDAVVGVTVWRLRPSLPADEVRELIHAPSKQSPDEEGLDMTAERLEAGTALDEGEFVQVGIESARAGYLYVINRELYSDGTKGTPLLIFPTRRTRRGNNLVRPGRLITIPAMNDDPPYFTVKPNPRRSDQVAELLLIIIADEPLNIPVTDRAQTLSASRVDEWEKSWDAPSERIEQMGGAGTAISPEEFRAGRQGLRELIQDDPAPQTIYRVRGGPRAPVLLSLQLPFIRSPQGAAP